MVTGFVQQLSVFGPLLCLWGVVVLGGHTSCRIEHGKLRANPKANALAKRINKAHALAKRIDNVPHTEGTSTTPKHHGETHTVSGCNASSNMSTNKCLVGNARAGSVAVVRTRPCRDLAKQARLRSRGFLMPSWPSIRFVGAEAFRTR